MDRDGKAHGDGEVCRNKGIHKDDEIHKKDEIQRKDEIRQATSNTIALVGLQFFTRVLTFLLNAAIIRLTTPSILGIATVKFELFYNTVLFLSREGLRLALLRYTDGGDEQEWIRKLVHMSWLALPCSVPVLIFFTLAYYHNVPVEIVQANFVGYFWLAIMVYMIAALVELALEPCFMICVHRQLIKKRVYVESLAMTLRVLTVLSTCLVLKGEGDPTRDLMIGLIAYPLGQIVYAVALSVGFLGIFHSAVPTRLSSLLPIPEIDIDEGTVQHALDMTKQVLLRYFLAQGDMWIVSIVSPLREQGVYAVATNYGSLLCRILFQPMEESALSLFSRTISSDMAVRADAEEAPRKRRMALEYLGMILKMDVLLSMFIIAYGIPMADPVINALLGKRWIGLSGALCAYCILLPPMAFSGVLEAFQHATMTRPWMSFYQLSSLGATVIFVTAAIIGTVSWGPIGLISASIVNFTVRLSLGLYYLDFWIRNHKLGNVKDLLGDIKSPITLYVYFAGLLALLSSLDCSQFFSARIFAAFTSLPITLSVLYYFERPFVNHLSSLRAKSD
jgi:oligosaccharide translocation protein RFT1